MLRYGKFGVENSEKRKITVNYIDWKNISANDFYVAEEVSVICRDGVQKKRPDLVFYVNGIALGMCELKNSAVSAGEAICQMLTNQKTVNTYFFNDCHHFVIIPIYQICYRKLLDVVLTLEN